MIRSSVVFASKRWPTVLGHTHIREHGRDFYYVEFKQMRDNWEPICYAHDRGWRVIGQTYDGPDRGIVKCEEVAKKTRGQGGD